MFQVRLENGLEIVLAIVCLTTKDTVSVCLSRDRVTDSSSGF